MREILFRGKSLNNGEWVEGSLVHRTQYYGDPDDSWYILTSGEFDYDYYDAEEVQDNTVGQYTGVADKNGKRIFEGDIVKTEGFCSIISVVEYYGGGFSPFAIPENELSRYGWECEVIGNIHDNPEMIGGGE